MIAGNAGDFMQVTGQALHRGAMAIVACVAAGLAWNTGFEGYMPLDQSIVWDGAWRVLQGQVPAIDFALPAGLTPILIQAGIFKIAGVAWAGYVAHAALANGSKGSALECVRQRSFWG